RAHLVDHRCSDPAHHRMAGMGSGVSTWRGSFSMMTLRSQPLRSAVLLTSLLCLSACNDGSGDPKAQIGANPTLPDVQQYLLPPMHIARVIGWKQGETPSVASGLKISSLATGLQHPRMVYTLPNGDVLVVESKAPPTDPIKRPKQIVLKYIESWATSGGD